ncbi:hypothetical protein GCM10028805_16610 [Spirosoma harenae]
MTLITRLRSFFSTRNKSASVSAAPVAASIPISASLDNSAIGQLTSELLAYTPPIPTYQVEVLPDWLADEASLRDEGVLFGLSEARPDTKVAQIRAYFGQQSAPLTESIEQHTEKIRELNGLIEQREHHSSTLRDQINDLRGKKPVTNNLVRNGFSFTLSVFLSIGAFFLIDETLRPVFPNHWIAIGVFLAGMFNLFGQVSFFYELNSRLSLRRLLEEIGLPLAASLFVLAHALQSKPLWQAISLFVFVFFVFLLSGKLLLSTLSLLQHDFSIIQQNRELVVNKAQNLPIWEGEISRLNQEIDHIRTQKWPVVTDLNQAEAALARLNTQRDAFVHLFISEFELARSLRDRLSEGQRNLLINYD